MARVEHLNRRGFLIGAGILGIGAVGYAADLVRRKFIPAISSGASIPAAPEPGGSALPAIAPATTTAIPVSLTEAATTTSVPTAIDTATNVPDTATATKAPATSTPSPTAIDTGTSTAVPTNTVEATKTPEVKPVLSNYAVYSDEKNFVFADLPPDPAKDPSGKHWLFIYEGVFTHGNASLNDPVITGDNSFNVLGFGVQIADAKRDDTKKEITGDWQMKGGTTLTPFKLNFKGVGLHVLLHECIAVFTIQQQLGSGKPIPDATMESQINDEFRKGYKGSDREGVYLHP